jgi:hypothetical protein
VAGGPRVTLSGFPEGYARGDSKNARSPAML